LSCGQRAAEKYSNYKVIGNKWMREGYIFNIIHIFRGQFDFTGWNQSECKCFKHFFRSVIYV